MEPGRSRSALKRLLRGRLAIIGAILVAALLVAGVFAPYLAPYDPDEMMFQVVFHAPSREYLLGTDALGRDLLSRIIWGARTSLVVGVGATLIAMAVGVVFGGLAGYYGGTTSQIFMRLADVQLCVPGLILLIVAAAVLAQRGIGVITLIIGLTIWPRLGRVTRSKVLDLRDREFVESARAAGANGGYILWRHILPNALGPIAVIATMEVGGAIIAEASLSYLGLSDPRMMSWGNILSAGLHDMVHAPWIAIFPGLAIFLAVWGLNMLGDALRDALDVQG